jgi:hypothetical protein
MPAAMHCSVSSFIALALSAMIGTRPLTRELADHAGA